MEIGKYVNTPRFCTVRISAIFENPEDAVKCGYVEPTYQEMFSANHVLRFVLLAIVYKTLGLSSEAIIDARKRVEFQLYYKDIETILNYANDQGKES